MLDTYFELYGSQQQSQRQINISDAQKKQSPHNAKLMFSMLFLNESKSSKTRFLPPLEAQFLRRMNIIDVIHNTNLYCTMQNVSIGFIV